MSMYDEIAKVDAEISKCLKSEWDRQGRTILLIASENFVPCAILAAQGSVATNKYAEGYPNQRYYGGCEDVDRIETLAIERAKQLFKAGFANVQPHSGSSANFSVFSALLKPNDCILGFSLNDGGHLTHGHPVNFSGQIYTPVYYGVNDNGLIDYDQVRALAKKHKPKMIISGGSAYSQVYDWAVFGEIAEEVGAYHLADMAHVSGLVAAGIYPSPIPHADVVTSTTHKTLRGPRSGMILGRENAEIERKINKGVFPGTQGGPLMHVIAAKAICYLRAMQEDFVAYQKQVVHNAQVMATVFMDEGFEVISGVPKCHLFLLSLQSTSLNGAEAQDLLESVGVIVNKNTIPNDPLPPRKTSGLRIGVPAMTTRGMNESMAKEIAQGIASLLMEPTEQNQAELKQSVQKWVEALKPIDDILGA